MEWSGDGIRVNTIMPLARTPAIEASFDAYPGLEDHLISGVPLGRLGDPETDIGSAVAFLAGPTASYITGTTLTIDGGSVQTYFTQFFDLDYLNHPN
jgi:3-oxoacyl-[acyl-carrier protein] reductase